MKDIKRLYYILTGAKKFKVIYSNGHESCNLSFFASVLSAINYDGVIEDTFQ